MPCETVEVFSLKIDKTNCFKKEKSTPLTHAHTFVRYNYVFFENEIRNTCDIRYVHEYYGFAVINYL